MRIIERKDAKYLLFGILEISEKKRENHSNSEKKHFERKEASQMCLASFHIKRDTEKSISANLGIFLPRQCPCSRTTVLKNTRRQGAYFIMVFLSPYSGGKPTSYCGLRHHTRHSRPRIPPRHLSRTAHPLQGSVRP